jgi:hypothetical protein
VPDPDKRPAFYAATPDTHGWRDWWTLLHPPYTAWHLSYVVIGACLASHVDALRLIASLLAFFAAVGIAAHALDELHGHPLRTRIADRALIAATAIGLLVAVALGVAGVFRVGPVLIPFIVIGPCLVLAYNLELFGGRLHTDIGFALSWGAFPLLTGYVAQAGRLEFPAIVAAIAAVGFSLAQRSLSTPARALRRRVSRVDGAAVMHDGTVRRLDQGALLAPLERALRALSWSMVALALALLGARLV